MKHLLAKFFLAAAPLLLLSSAHAAIDPALVGADAQWVVYANLNGLRASTLGGQLIGMAEKAPQFQAAIGNVHVNFEKVLATVGSVTAYGTNLTHDPRTVDGTLIVRGTADLRKIAEGVLAQATITTPEKVTEADGFPFSTYLIGGQVLVGFPDDTTILVSKSKGRLLDALAVIKGTSSSLAKAPASAVNGLLDNAADALIFAATVVPSDNLFPRGGPQARILQMAKSGSLSLGEHGAETFAHVTLVAGSEQMADKLTKILQGLTALISLGESNDQALTAFMNSATVQRTDQRVSLDMQYDSARLADLIKTIQNGRPATRPPRYGKVAAEWRGEAPAAPAADGQLPPAPLDWKTVENVHLGNGAQVTLAILGDTGPTRARFDRIEILPMTGTEAPLVFRPAIMRLIGFRTRPDARMAVSGDAKLAVAQFSFPGEDGTYKVRIHLADDSAGQSAFSLSVKDAEPVRDADQAPAASDDAVRPASH